MRLLHIAPIGHHVEGIGSVISELIPEQIKAGLDIRVVSIYENSIYSNINIKTITNRSEFNSFLDFWHPDFVLFHSVYKKEFLFMYKSLVSRNIKYAVQMHGCLSKEHYSKNHIKKVIANTLFYNRFLKKAKAIIYLNEAEQERCIVRQINDSSIVIPNGTKRKNIEICQPLKNDKTEIFFVGRISMYVKGLDLLMDAIEQLKGRQDVHFSIYGNETDQDVAILRQRIAGKEGLVDYYGGLYGTQKDMKMRNANIFILTSPSEGMPMGVLDALSYGIPCIVTPGTNMADVIRDNNCGWVSSYDSNDIAKTIVNALNDYETDQMRYRKNALQLSQNYTWDNIAKYSISQIKKIFSES